VAPRSISTASISFGLVTIPVRLYPATQVSAGLSFHLLHVKDGARLKQQFVCTKDGEVVPRSEVIKGYEFEKGHYVTFTDKELKALDQEATHGIEIAEFVPFSTVDPVYFERPYYLAPDKGGDKAFALLARALEEQGLVAIGQYAARGKDYLVEVRPQGRHLVMHQLLHSDEVRSLDEIPEPSAEVKAPELKLARELIRQLAADEFTPKKYEDRVRKRIRALIERKIGGEEITAAPQAKPGAQVIDLMEALRKSLARKSASPAAPSRGRARPSSRAKRAVAHARTPTRKAG
jgi:DNA end-binding protein Ku